ncbi:MULTISPECIES: undecaprenyldiphospho-muramoylpentapeptide beta-N-acetylglucosaminyltransferase [unclassified Ruminococcus]|uniref:undecaprenyldiphospho-muramoylpentapeptide beta-N-acetylglucosaminyltransferase n=1 Tax=unclassified Ruminococcus TaxID=2608920 RepID=UPI002109EE5A|nr:MULTISPECIES: undecaprenyldiphospho-muramoylpentapeptide beta-N-acetylglucosaminyltransferase [unclassified Ruminococcus]MCQ4022337.1 undecaprenyldiphospho-muramoylpentapeptide beta-N-acetylglucosaminyltransferase [Ruminococcus sp. zg-924]MCQ4114665.1 undecaprenyldiphospho-muramoylpentapeptide beta-N-acetylglucosaminyltransferase [Ruminococcus sp. zg-921]
MRVIFAGGGTAGHINPALAIAGYLKDKDPKTEILYIGAQGGMEERLVPQAGFKIKTIKISGFKRSLSPKALKDNIVTLKRAFSSTADAKKIIKEFKPDICIGTGGYVSGPVIRAAIKLKIPAIIHEQNAFPGVTTKMLSKNVQKVMLANPYAKKYLSDSCHFVTTGNPVRGEIITAAKEPSRKELGLDMRPVVLSFGGSLGARKINEGVADLIARSGKDGKYQIIHAYGQYGKWFPDLLRKKGIEPNDCENLDIREYINNMSTCLAAADLVICRAGAITLSELQVQGKPAILIPSPNVAENHQYHNAMSMVDSNAAFIIEESELTGEKVIEYADRILGDENTLKEYSQNAGKMAIVDANDRIYSVIRTVLNGVAK